MLSLSGVSFRERLSRPSVAGASVLTCSPASAMACSWFPNASLMARRAKWPSATAKFGAFAAKAWLRWARSLAATRAGRLDDAIRLNPSPYLPKV